MRIAWLGMVAWAAVAGGAAGAAAGASPVDGAVHLVLAAALPGEKPMDLHLDLHGGKVRRAIASARTFNRMAYEVDASGLAVEGGRLAGTVKVTIPSDGYMPKGVESVACEYRLDVSGLPAGEEAKASGIRGTFEGTYGSDSMRGTVTGTWLGRGSPVAGRFVLSCERALPAKKNRAVRVSIAFGLRDGKAYGIKLDPPGSITDVGFGARSLRDDLCVKDGRLTGTMTALIAHQADNVETLELALDGAVIGSAAAGRIEARRSGQVVARGCFTGAIDESPPPDPANALVTLVLHDALGVSSFLKLYLSARDGRFSHGFGASPNFNNATHAVEVDGLKLDGKALSGTIKVAVHPDPWIPKDHRPIACVFQVRGAIDGAEIAGTYEGTAGGKAVKGVLDGDLAAKAPIGSPVKVTLKLENALTGGSDWGNRAFLGMDLDGESIKGGNVSNNHTALKGVVDGGRFVIDGETFTATPEITVEARGGVDPGRYAFRVRGVVVGKVLAGEFETFRGGGEMPIKTGRLWGTFRSAP